MIWAYLNWSFCLRDRWEVDTLQQFSSFKFFLQPFLKFNSYKFSSIVVEKNRVFFKTNVLIHCFE
jgi:hypothetical protein